MTVLFVILFTILTALPAFANCVTFNISTWTPDQRDLLNHVAVTAVGDSVKLKRLVDRNVEVCTPTADLTGLNIATLQTAAQATLDTQVTASTNRQAQRTAAEDRVRTNNLCTAGFTEIEDHIEAQRLTIRTAITNSGTITALKDATQDGIDRYAVILKKTLECVLGRATLQGQEN